MSIEALNQLMPQSGHAHESPEASCAASKFEIRISHFAQGATRDTVETRNKMGKEKIMLKRKNIIVKKLKKS